jgi:hypothetical protein
MLPLAGSHLPASPFELSEAITRGLAHYGVGAGEVLVEGGEWPAIEQLTVNLTGARVTRDLRLPRGGPPSGEQLRISRIDVTGRPLFFETIPFQLALATTDATLGLARGEDGVSLLTLVRVGDGEITIEAQRADLETLAHSLIVPIAAQQGVDIKATRMTLRSLGPRALEFQIEVTAKMFVVSARAAVSGNVEVDDRFDARLSQLTCTGHGMIASAASAFLRPHLQKLEQRTFSLLGLPLGEVKLHDVSLTAGETVRLHARFGA